MSSLFTRAFLSFWVTIVVFALSAAALTAANFLAESVEPQRLAKQAQAVLDGGGEPGLKAWLVARESQDPQHHLLLVDSTGHELLGRRLPAMPRPPPPAGTRPMADPNRGPPPMRAVDPLPDLLLFPRITSPDGATYIVLLDPPPHRGLFSPPFSLLALAILLLLALVISGLVSYAYARSIARPLELLQGTARQLASGRLEARTAPSVGRRRDEVGVLAREMDSMAGRLAAMVDARQHLLRDMSHELRSPLTRLQIAVGLVRQPGTDREKQLARIERESGRLEQLVASILDYARLERDFSTLAREEVNLLDLVQRVVHDAEFETQAPAGRINLAVSAGADGPAGRFACADSMVLHTAIDNVVRNALIHGGDGPIEVGIGAASGEVSIDVRDHGRGVPAQDLARIFEPFYRVVGDESASSASGYGIGLALAARAAELHGGRVEAANVEGGGLRVSIVLPLDRERRATR